LALTKSASGMIVVAAMNPRHEAALELASNDPFANLME